MRRRTALLLTAVTGSAAVACAPVWRMNQSGNPYVAVAAETALISYDPDTKTEHFIRRGTFAATTADFGFLVPTPSVPDLAEADPAVFADLERGTAPRHVYETKEIVEYGFGLGCGSDAKSTFANVGDKLTMTAPAARVEVLKQQKVGGYDAAVLKADDAAKLNAWLAEHGYATRPELNEWLKWYTDNKWILTAFKIGGAAPQSIVSGTVRMSFKTDAPFYPYREPADSRGDAAAKQRMLRVYYLGDKQYAGTVGKESPWPASAVWANASPVPAASVAERMKLTAAAKDEFEKKAWTLTEFEDRSSPRPGTDEVYFRPAADQSPKERPPIVHTTYTTRLVPGPAAGIAVFGIGAVLGLFGVVLLARRLFRQNADPA